MNNVFKILVSQFEACNLTISSQQKIPSGWVLIDEIAIGDEISIFDHLALYEVPEFDGADRYVFVRVANGELADFGWSYSPSTYARLFEEVWS
jgi:hypothetical protein